MPKKCNNCKEEKPISHFYRNNTCKDGRRGECKKCRRKYNMSNIVRNMHLRRNYHMTVEDYNKLLNLQNKKCAICKSVKPGGKSEIHFSVDHCHDSNKVRGLLCANCNRGIGSFKDDINILKAAIEYLQCL
jgi:hypothetical protein